MNRLHKMETGTFRFSSPGPGDAHATRRAAMHCLAVLERCRTLAGEARLTPLKAIESYARALEREAAADQAWVIRTDATEGEGTLASAWPLWFGRNARRFERPLLYLLHACSVTQLRVRLAQLRQRGVLCNDVAWPRHRAGDLPLWLADNLTCLPYDPASAGEAWTIMANALRDLYVGGARRLYYLSAHDHADEASTLLDAAQAADAVRGMYRVRPPRAGQAAVRLLAAGATLRTALRAADRLWQDWRVIAEVWSCPSYTRLAREARDAEGLRLLRPSAPVRRAHLVRCLGRDGSPVVASTAYPRRIAEQIGAHVQGRFVAVGGDSPTLTPLPPALSAEGLAIRAIQALCDEGRLPAAALPAAIHRYASGPLPADTRADA